MISTVVITTKDRPELVQRAIDSFRSANADRELTYVVYDQSETRPEYHGVDRLIGPPEISAFIDRLVSKGFDRDLVQWGLVGGHGGYRNVAMLDTIGEHVLSTDDDTLCQFIGTLDQEEQFRYGQPEPCWRSFASREEWQKWSINLPSTLDLIAEHERYVGQRTQDGYTFCVVASGLIGDSAASFNPNLFVSGEDLKRLVSDYESMRDTREVMQIVPRPTMCPGSTFLRTMNYSFDNRVELPPFPPNGRGECAVFASVLRYVDKTVVAYLPWGVVHVPPEGRQYISRFGPLNFDEAFYAVSSASGAQSVVELGKALMALESLEDRHAHEMFAAYREHLNHQFRERVRELLESEQGSSAWRLDCEDLVSQSTVPDQVTLITASAMKQELVMYGRLLLEWPRLREASL